MACEFSVYVPPLTPGGLDAAQAGLDEIEAMEALLTVYNAASPMSYVNQHAGRGPVRVDARMFSLLERSAEITRKTEGAFDVSAGALVRAWGFLHGPKRVPNPTELQAALACTGMAHVELDKQESTVRYHRPGLEINLGSIGKGYAIDRAVRRMRDEFGVTCVLMQGGLSSVYAAGSPIHGRDAGATDGWLVGIQDPYDAARRVGTVRLRDRALGTSGSAQQYFEAAGRRYGHVLDPRTGMPADDLASASVIARDAAEADALATALFVMGLDKAADFCDHHRDVGAVLVLKRGDRRGRRTARSRDLPSVVTLNLPREDWEPAEC